MKIARDLKSKRIRNKIKVKIKKNLALIQFPKFEIKLTSNELKQLSDLLNKTIAIQEDRKGGSDID